MSSRDEFQPMFEKPIELEKLYEVEEDDDFGYETGNDKRTYQANIRSYVHSFLNMFKYEPVEFMIYKNEVSFTPSFQFDFKPVNTFRILNDLSIINNRKEEISSTIYKKSVILPKNQSDAKNIITPDSNINNIIVNIVDVIDTKLVIPTPEQLNEYFTL